MFSNDVDLLKYEPKLFTDLYFASQVLTSGTGGILAGTAFTKAGENFITAGISAGTVIYLKSVDGSLDGAFEIVSVDSAEQLTVSVLRADPEQAAIPPRPASDVTYRIATFAPQANEAFNLLLRCFDLTPDDAENLLEPDRLKQASVFIILSGIYATLTGDADTSEEFWKKSLHYRTLFEKARDQIILSIDEDADGTGEEEKRGDEIRLLRD
jgi:hypothetical protein